MTFSYYFKGKCSTVSASVFYFKKTFFLLTRILTANILWWLDYCLPEREYSILLFFFLRSWLDGNEASAVVKLKKSLPLREELERLKFELSHQLQLSDIR